MQISELAQLTGVSTHALRHYEKLGMLEPARRPSGYREYPEAMRREVIFIAMSRKVGIPLKLIAAQLPAYRAGQLTITQMVEALQARVLEIEQQTERLNAQRIEVISHIAWLKKQDRAYQAKQQRLAMTRVGHVQAPWPAVRARSRLNSQPPRSTPTKAMK
ncbi:MerR family DNA-binding transcriptional regulator [Rhodoferax sp.]|uniref:MerR family DNA-binding transcriptional regulator n=1 Tax=Rhodoferax sp. TaxID=50421 RepID=UPI001EC4B2F4|nr:MerR family DNA-binding transcriptional regulator [Rhodoferax sp.]MBT9507288.1 MerR family DNA-binding transcriptional regulator [Rhodoferax sp.]